MTEAEWLGCSAPAPMLDALGDRASARKLRLFACACWRRLEEPLPHLRNPTALDTAERFADGLASGEELREVRRRVGNDLHTVYHHLEVEVRDGLRHPRDAHASTRLEAEYSALRELSTATSAVVSRRALGYGAARAAGGVAAGAALRAAVSDWDVRGAAEDAIRAEEAAQADLVRDLFADRFWFVVPDPAWFTADVLALANAIYDGRTFEHMPILADALQDAGCESPDVLDHCRGARPHARGCWVVDLVLGRV